MDKIQQIQKLCKDKGYRFFTEGPYNLNIIGLRGDYKADTFNCKLAVIFRPSTSSELTMFEFPCTTYPGVHWIKAPMNAGGTAIMVPGQYSGAYLIGKHFSVDALVQQGNEVAVYRTPKDATGKIIIDPKSIIKGYFGINIHPVMDRNEETIGQDSAGCQVIQRNADYQLFMALCRKAASIYGNKFTYTLLEWQP